MECNTSDALAIKREDFHLSRLNNGKHERKAMQKDYDKYAKHFGFTILKTFTWRRRALKYERTLIAKFRDTVYNREDKKMRSTFAYSDNAGSRTLKELIKKVNANNKPQILTTTKSLIEN